MIAVVANGIGSRWYACLCNRLFGRVACNDRHWRNTNRVVAVPICMADMAGIMAAHGQGRWYEHLYSWQLSFMPHHLAHAYRAFRDPFRIELQRVFRKQHYHG